MEDGAGWARGPRVVTYALLVVAGILSANQALALPPDATGATFQINLFDDSRTFNIVSENLVQGDVRPLAITEVQFIDNAAGTMAGFVTVSYNGLCINYTIGPDADGNSSPEGPFGIRFTVAGADGLSDAGSTATIDFEQGSSPPSNTTSCNDPDNLDPIANDIARSLVDTDPQSVILDALDPQQVQDEYPAGLVLAIQGNSNPTLGPVVVQGQQILFTPVAGSTGSADITYSVTDPEFLSATGTITVTVNGSDGPQVADDFVDVPYNAVDQLVDVLENDDPDPGIQIVAVTQPSAGGTAEIFFDDLLGEVVRYSAPQDFVGTETFRYQVQIGEGPTAEATVIVTVAGNTPTPRDDDAYVPPGGSVVIEVLENDGPDPSALTIVSVSEPANGTATIAADSRTVTYRPNEGFGGGSDSFSYTVTDGNAGTPDRSAQVTVTVGTSLIPLATNPTQRAVASAIDVVCPQLGELPADERDPTSGTGKLLNRCSALIEQGEQELGGAAPEGGVSNALQQIAGEEMLSQGTSSVKVANLQTSNVGSRIAALRGGAAGVSLGGVALNIEGTQVPSAALAAMLPEWLQGAGGASGDEESPWSRFGLFLNGKWNFGDKDETDLEAGFDFDTYGLTGGFDYRFTDNFVLGLAIGYSTTDIEFARDGGSIDSDGLTYTAYGTAYAGDFYVDFSAGFGNADFDATRSLNFVDTRGGVDSETRGSTSGDQKTLSVSGGYNFTPGGWVIGPYLSVDYLDADIDPFTEKEVSSDGSDGWALAYEGQKVESLVATGGLRISYVVSADWGVFIPHLRAALQHEFEDDASVVHARFANDPGGTTFEFVGDAPDSDFYQAAAGFSFVTKHGFSGFLDYEVLAGYENLKSNTLTVGIRFDRAFR